MLFRGKNTFISISFHYSGSSLSKITRPQITVSRQVTSLVIRHFLYQFTVVSKKDYVDAEVECVRVFPTVDNKCELSYCGRFGFYHKLGAHGKGVRTLEIC